ncbi:AraC family transcriptional regulator [Amycolatopsis suaedae]|uniref:AraC family transcriptional regulator n=1 Tax=Amycolatopsis suaedae TaxID=2510978 RepID=A0A4Q7J6K2_9PSEU|nr:AraC family transcriptional regulator [Amycolatopsis suaedae]RZQ62466.1 AraC family transcriptional regulator [Amycolatopsis suaedae]
MEEFAHYNWHQAMSGLAMLHARFLHHEFSRHAHDTYTIGVLDSGREELRYGRDTEYAGAGAIVLINPEIVHTGRSVDEYGWSYVALYPPVWLVRSLLGAQPVFTSRIVNDPRLARQLRALPNADADDLTIVLRRLFAEHATPYTDPEAGPGLAQEAQQLLLDQFRDPPGLAELASRFGVSQYSVLRAFRHRYGMPPHAYLNQYRVGLARRLIERGHPLPDVATEVGFVDQAHLTRHFRRMVGTTPGRYQRAAQERTRPLG